MHCNISACLPSVASRYETHYALAAVWAWCQTAAASSGISQPDSTKQASLAHVSAAVIVPVRGPFLDPFLSPPCQKSSYSAAS